MDAKTYKAQRQRIGSWETVADLLGVHWRTIARREAGELPITVEAARAIQALSPTWFASPPPLPVLAGVAIRPVPAYPGYAATDDGRVFGCRSKCPNRAFAYKAWTALKATRGSRGYWLVALNRDGHRKQFKLHQLVLLTFVGPKPAGQCGRHLDDDRNNNRLVNLAWGTASQNRRDMVRNGHMPDRKGEKHPLAKLTSLHVRQIRRQRQQGQTLASIGRCYGISEAMVCRIAKRRSWRHVD